MLKSIRTLINFKSLTQHKNIFAATTNFHRNVMTAIKINKQRYYHYYKNDCDNSESHGLIYFMGWSIFYIISSFTNDNWEITGGKIAGCIMWPFIFVVTMFYIAVGACLWGIGSLFGAERKGKF